MQWVPAVTLNPVVSPEVWRPSPDDEKRFHGCADLMRGENTMLMMMVLMMMMVVVMMMVVTMMMLMMMMR